MVQLTICGTVFETPVCTDLCAIQSVVQIMYQPVRRVFRNLCSIDISGHRLVGDLYAIAIFGQRSVDEWYGGALLTGVCCVWIDLAVLSRGFFRQNKKSRFVFFQRIDGDGVALFFV